MGSPGALGIVFGLSGVGIGSFGPWPVLYGRNDLLANFS
jgi:hypothetical protein